MRNLRLVAGFTSALFVAVFLVFRCADVSTNPFSPENASVALSLVSSDFTESDTAITDTAGNKIRLKVCLYLTQHIDSTVITVGKSLTSLDTAIVCYQKARVVDTVLYTLSFTTAGDRTVIATSYVGKNLRPATKATIRIFSRPVSNRKPTLTISGKRELLAGQTCALEATANDPDSGQVITIKASEKPAGATFDGRTFSWNTTTADTGVHTIAFVADDDGTPPLSDTATISISVTAPGTNRPPQWSQDTLIRAIQTGTLFSLTLTDLCSDPDNDTLHFRLLAGLPPGDTVRSGTYSFTPSASDTGTFSSHIIAIDSLSAADTLAVHLTVFTVDNDTLPPIIKRFDPAKDSASINASSYAVKVVCNDQSGVASVVYALGSATFPAQKGAGDTVWSANVTGLTPNALNAITVIATDASLRANKDTLVISINYDPTMADSVGPVIFQKSGPATGAMVTDSIVTIIDSISDPSGIDSVYRTLNNGNRKPMTLVSGKQNWYSLTDTLKRFGLDTLVIFAIDKATAGNRSSQTIVLTYALPPTITTPLPTTSTVVSGSATPLLITATGTPSPNYQWYKGSSVIPQATAASYSKTWGSADTGSYKVVVSNIAGKDSSSTQLVVNRAPTITEQPASLTKCPGDTATFTVIATGTPPLSYQWKKGSANTGFNSPTLVISHVISANAGSYTVIVSNLAGSDTSSEALLSVNTVSSKPTITPALPTTCPGVPLTLHLSGGTLGTGASWKWYTGSCGGTPVGSDSTLTVNPSVTTIYYVRAEGGCQTTDCAFAEVTVNTIPTVTTQPLSQTVWVGDSATFSIAATGTATLSYQWYRGATPLGTNSPSLTIKPVVFADSGNYTCVVTNSCGKDTSEGGRLTVRPVFSVSFNSNGGSAVPSQAVKSDSLAKKPANPTLSGCTFAEWYSDSTLTTLFVFSTRIIADKILYAKWVVIDIDGNIYNTVTIGTQMWLVENLKTTRFNDGSEIPLVTDSAAWMTFTTPAYCWYDNDSSANKNFYGALYNWHAVYTEKLAPIGWHVPSDSEWNVLTMYLGGDLVAGGKMKEVGTSHWASPNANATNESGFTALPGGSRNYLGFAGSLGYMGYWWLSTENDISSASLRYLQYDLESTYCISTPKPCGLSVRCIKN